MIPPRLQLRPAHDADGARRAVAAMGRALSSIGWAPGGGEATVRVDLSADEGPVAEAVLAIDADAGCFVAAFNFAVRAAAHTRAEVMRFATRANWELLAGDFELDLASGDVRFRVSVPFSGGELPESLIRSTLGAALGVVDAYADALDEVIGGRACADEALARIWVL